MMSRLGVWLAGGTIALLMTVWGMESGSFGLFGTGALGLLLVFWGAASAIIRSAGQGNQPTQQGQEPQPHRAELLPATEYPRPSRANKSSPRTIDQLLRIWAVGSLIGLAVIVFGLKIVSLPAFGVGAVIMVLQLMTTATSIVREIYPRRGLLWAGGHHQLLDDERALDVFDDWGDDLDWDWGDGGDGDGGDGSDGGDGGGDGGGH
ncbi:hypothetical protein SAMN02745857_02699 [Andreprevotia lacus DSM 23236]|jgi:hypothetical protein|uniref:Uncharacterized protein n=1 Tax=Andreprevotia lacus DSM 23236 TaxID=1121001 RepID=A0A1W1XSZ1_9NEIS|nr:hypothetical protein [Andreprevotia lacus]SMC27073.1 hypothetical protein SAMN02745857_02699 [Andreprevotia lacus DSM 23236]